MTKQLVKTLQRALNRVCNSGLSVDGGYGKLTHSASMAALDHLSTLKGVAKDGGTKEPDKSAISKPVPVNDTAYNIVLLPARRRVTELIWHCAATPEGKSFSVETIRSWHKQRGWDDIGYHYVIDIDGTIYIGRPIHKKGAHVKGRNTGTIGCCYVGGVSADGKRAKDTRTPAQREAMLWLTKQLTAKHNLKKISGHNQYAAKACPSFDVTRDELGNIPGFKNGLRKWIGS